MGRGGQTSFFVAPTIVNLFPSAQQHSTSNTYDTEMNIIKKIEEAGRVRFIENTTINSIISIKLSLFRRLS